MQEQGRKKPDPGRESLMAVRPGKGVIKIRAGTEICPGGGSCCGSGGACPFAGRALVAEQVLMYHAAAAKGSWNMQELESIWK